MKYYVVIDTNVLVSAVLKSHSVPGSIVELAFDGPIIPILNEAIEKEYREVLSRPKFHLPEDLIEGIMSTFHMTILSLAHSLTSFAMYSASAWLSSQMAILYELFFIITICFSFLFNHLKRLKCLDNGFFLFLRRLR